MNAATKLDDLSASDSSMPERSTPSPLPSTSFKRQQSNSLHPHLTLTLFTSILRLPLASSNICSLADSLTSAPQQPEVAPSDPFVLLVPTPLSVRMLPSAEAGDESSS